MVTRKVYSNQELYFQTIFKKMFEVRLFAIFEIKIEHISLEDNLSRGKIVASLIT